MKPSASRNFPIPIVALALAFALAGTGPGCGGSDLEITGGLPGLEEDAGAVDDEGETPSSDDENEDDPVDDPFAELMDAGASEGGEDAGEGEEEDAGGTVVVEEDAGGSGGEDAGEDAGTPVVLTGCADPANEGKACSEVTATHACGVAVCQSGACVEVAGKKGVQCRAASGACDAAESCDGSGLDCPADGYKPSTTVCRASVGGCDAAEYCTGSSKSCPADVFDGSCACPKDGPISGYAEHSGLRKIAASSFVLKDTGTWSSYEGIIDKLGLAKVKPEGLDLNRSMTSLGSKTWKGYVKGWKWASGDVSVSYWIPQGLGGGTSGDRTFRVVGWHYDETKKSADGNPAADQSDGDKGTRVSFVDTTDTSATLKYRHVLLVEPDASKGFKPVKNHVGGLAWNWPYLYVADTNRGVRAFDMTRMLKVSTADACDTRVGLYDGKYCGYGYAYVLPQTGGYYFPSGLGASCKPKFSYIALDRGGGDSTILSGEYFNDTGSNIYGRLFRWPMASGGKMKADAGGNVFAVGAWYLGNRNVQGAVSHGASDPVFLLNVTRYNGALITGKEGAKSTVLKASAGKWAYMPEGMYISASGNLWVSTEGHSNLDRCVFYADVDEIL